MVRKTSIGLIAVFVFAISVGCADKVGKILAANLDKTQLTAAVFGTTLLPTYGQRVVVVTPSYIYPTCTTNCVASIWTIGGSCVGPTCSNPIATASVGQVGSIGDPYPGANPGGYYQVDFTSGYSGYVSVYQIEPAISNKFTIAPHKVNGAFLPTDRARVVVASAGVIDSLGVPPFPKLYPGQPAAAVGTVVDGPVNFNMGSSVGSGIWWKVDFDTGPDGWVLESQVDPVLSNRFSAGARTQAIRLDSVYDGTKTVESVSGRKFVRLVSGKTVLGTQPLGARGTIMYDSPTIIGGVICWYVNFDSGVDGCFPNASLGNPFTRAVSPITFQKITLPLPPGSSSGSSQLQTYIDSLPSTPSIPKPSESALQGIVTNMQNQGLSVSTGGAIQITGQSGYYMAIGQNADGRVVVATADATGKVVSSQFETVGNVSTYTYGNPAAPTSQISVSLVSHSGTAPAGGVGENYVLVSKIDSKNQIETMSLGGPTFSTFINSDTVTLSFGTLTTFNGATGEITVSSGEGIALKFANPPASWIVTPGVINTGGITDPERSTSDPWSPDGMVTDWSPTSPDGTPSETVTAARVIRRAASLVSSNPVGATTVVPVVKISASPISVGYGGKSIVSWQSTGASSCIANWTASVLPTSGSFQTVALYGSPVGTPRSFAYTVNCVSGKTWSGSSTASVSAAGKPQGTCVGTRCNAY